MGFAGTLVPIFTQFAVLRENSQLRQNKLFGSIWEQFDIRGGNTCITLRAVD